MCIYVYVYIYRYMYMYIYIYIQNYLHLVFSPCCFGPQTHLRPVSGAITPCRSNTSTGDGQQLAGTSGNQSSQDVRLRLELYHHGHCIDSR